MFGSMTDVNIWNRSLSQSEVEQWSRCELGVGGNLLDWNTAQWRAVGLQEEELDKQDICGKKKFKKHLMVFQKKKTFDATVKHCRSMGGDMAVAKDNITLQMMIAALQPFSGDCDRMFSGYNDRAEDRVWRDNSGAAQLWVQWEEVEPDNWAGGQHCLKVEVGTGLSGDTECEQRHCPVCLLAEQTVFHMQGICLESYIDRLYIMQTPRMLLGYMQTRMVWVEENKRWEIVNLIKNSTEAFMNSSTDFPFGTHAWYFIDGSGCTDTKQEWRSLNLHRKVVQPGMICCTDGSCGESNWKCDGETDCSDASDEEDCDLITVPPTYNKQIPPRPFSEEATDEDPYKYLIIKVKSSIFNIIEIDESQSLFKLSFGVELKWRDRYLTYNFLDNQPQRNVVTEDNQKKIWLPKLHFLSLLETMLETGKNFFVEKAGRATMENELNEIYSGTENILTIETIQQAAFICSFDQIKYYPFGRQRCSFKLFIPGINNNITKLVPGQIIDDGPRSVGEYQVLQWTVQAGPVFSENQKKFSFNYSKIENSVGLTYTVHLSRKISNVILVTYLPTFLMNLINQATNYISSPDKYELIITVNITCMMVLSSIYLAVSTSLPATAEIKPVEVWLLFSLVYPVLVIVLNILIQVNHVFFRNIKIP